MVALLLPVFLVWKMAGCRKGPERGTAAPPAITFMGWGPVTESQMGLSEAAFEEFRRQSGIQLHFIPGIESESERIQLYSRLLENKTGTPDVLLVDEIWMGALAEHFADLRPTFGDKLDELVPAGVKNDVVNGRLVAMPFVVETGVLYYRTDLLKKYGFAQPPETWDEMEKMATRIQAGERAAGKQNFWGFVWQGAAYEGLTCNALEWQLSHGGGRIIEEDRTISVNNPQAIAAMERARRWLGTISPPSVTEYKEEDSRNIFLSGNAAFQRDWVWTIVTRGQDKDSQVRDRFSSVEIPSGGAGHASVYGGMSLAVSKYSQHPKETIKLVRYMTTAETQEEFWEQSTLLPARRGFFKGNQYLEAKPQLAALRTVFERGSVTRPSTITGKHYADVSRAYFTAVHSILTGKVAAGAAFADLESELVRITGFPKAATRTTRKQAPAN